MSAPTFSAFIARPPDPLAENVANAKEKGDPMVSKAAVLLLSVGRLLTMPGLAFAQDDLMAKARQQVRGDPNAAPELPGNAATPAKVELGKMLYFDPRLSASHIISCNSCHNLGLGGADAQSTPIGHRWQHGGRNAPTVLNVVFNKGPVLGRPGQGPRTAGRWADGQSGRDGLA
jgi:cytochrome c peroxidase